MIPQFTSRLAAMSLFITMFAFGSAIPEPDLNVIDSFVS